MVANGRRILCERVPFLCLIPDSQWVAHNQPFQLTLEAQEHYKKAIHININQ